MQMAASQKLTMKIKCHSRKLPAQVTKQHSSPIHHGGPSLACRSIRASEGPSSQFSEASLIVCQQYATALLPHIDQISDKEGAELRLQLPEMLQDWPPLTTRLLLSPGEVIINTERLLSELTSCLEGSMLRVCRNKYNPDRPRLVAMGLA